MRRSPTSAGEQTSAIPAPRRYVSSHRRRHRSSPAHRLPLTFAFHQVRAALEEAKQSGGTQATAVKRLREAHHSSPSHVVVHVAELDEPEEEPDDGSPSWSPPEEFEVVVRKDRKHGLGIELSRDCRVIGFHGRGAQDAGVPRGAQLLSVAGINLRGAVSYTHLTLPTILLV